MPFLHRHTKFVTDEINQSIAGDTFKDIIRERRGSEFTVTQDEEIT